MESRNDPLQMCGVLGTTELLSQLRERKIRNRDIADALGIEPSRVSEMFKGVRRVQLDEAKKLVEAFRLNEERRPLNIPVARLCILYLADAIGAPLSPDDPLVEELAQDIRAFSAFASDPERRENPDVIEGFFQGLRLAPGRTNGS